MNSKPSRLQVRPKATRFKLEQWELACLVLVVGGAVGALDLHLVELELTCQLEKRTTHATLIGLHTKLVPRQLALRPQGVSFTPAEGLALLWVLDHVEFEVDSAREFADRLRRNLHERLL